MASLAFNEISFLWVMVRPFADVIMGLPWLQDRLLNWKYQVVRKIKREEMA